MLWSKSLETGIAVIDEQHQNLFNHIEFLKDASNKNRYSQILEFLSEYIRKHFADEETMHHRLGYPDEAKHQRMHQTFVRVFSDLKKEFESSGEKLTVLMKINKTVIEWLTGHIMVHDKAFATFCRGREG